MLLQEYWEMLYFLTVTEVSICAMTKMEDPKQQLWLKPNNAMS